MAMTKHNNKATRFDVRGHKAIRKFDSKYGCVYLIPVTVFDYDDCHCLVFQIELKSPYFTFDHTLHFNCTLEDFRELSSPNDLSIYSVHSINPEVKNDFSERVLRELVFDFVNKTRLAWIFNEYPDFLSVFDERGSNFIRKGNQLVYLKGMVR